MRNRWIFCGWVWLASTGASAGGITLGHDAAFLNRLETPPPSVVAQTVTLDGADLSALTKARIGQVVDLQTLSLGLSKQAALKFRRVEIYSAGARVRVSDSSGEFSVSPSGRHFFVGVSATGGAGFSFDPATGALRGLLVEGGESFAIDAYPGYANKAVVQLKSLRAARAAAGFQCGNKDLPDRSSMPAVEALAFPSLNAMPKGSGVLYQATIAIDTDNEFLWNKFANDSAAARDWIEDLFVALNAFYEPDLQMRLLLGDVFLRVDNTPSGAPDFNQDPDGFNDGLSEYSSFGAANYGGVQRVFAGLLSGKDISSNSFSGVAWIGGYCSNSYGYSHNRIGSAGFITPAFIAGGFGHEVGHNLGSSHTHCEPLAGGGDFVDHCYANERSGCYDGATACPAGMAGSLMSYCHAPSSGFDGGGPGEGPPSSCSNSDSFHPLIVGKISGLLAANNPSCIADFVELGIIHSDGFEN